MFFLCVMFVNQYLTTRWLCWVPLGVCGVPLLFYAFVREKHPRLESDCPTTEPSKDAAYNQGQNRTSDGSSKIYNGSMPTIKEEAADGDLNGAAGGPQTPKGWTTQTQKSSLEPGFRPTLPAIHVELSQTST